jgi:HK97 gp10 family phage protein
MIRAEGAAALAERLEGIAGALKQNVTAAVTAEAGELLAEAKRRCPADTGRLRDSLRAGVRTRGADIEATVGSDLDYAGAVELGTLTRPPAPYLAPTFKARGGAAAERVKQAVRNALKGEVE